jgi:DNA-binding protein YbaB
MTDPGQARVDQMFAEFAQQRDALTEAAREIAQGSFTVTAKKRAFSVTVDSNAELTEIKFLTGAYRSMARAELAGQLVEAIGEARRQAIAAGLARFQGLVPPELPLADIMSGSFDVESMLADALNALEEPTTATGATEGDRDGR